MSRYTNLVKVAVLMLLLSMMFACGQGKASLASTWEGKAVVINYWATWCAPCRKEVPELNELYNEAQGRWLVYGINFDSLQGEELKQAVDDLGIEFPLLREQDIAHLALEIPQGLPATYIIGPDGVLKHSLYGPQTVSSLKEHLSLPH